MFSAFTNSMKIPELRSRILASSSADDAVDSLRAAGYAGGESLFAAFEQWLSETHGSPVDVAEMDLGKFGSTAQRFFRDAGWGEMQLSHDEDDDVATLTITNCWEAPLGNGCHIYTGILASFFGRVAGYPIAVLETSCSPDGSCEFMIGNEQVMTRRWEQLNG
jgi:predicted hydrocarbon binding protein